MQIERIFPNQWSEQGDVKGMNILVTGAQLANKGAESMLYIVIDEMKKRYPDATIYFATDCDYDESLYSFKKFYMTERGLDIAVGGMGGVYIVFKEVVKDFIKICIGRKTLLGHFFDVKRQFKDMDLMIDVSGFNLGNQWSKSIHQIYLNRIELARRYNIPVYLMPQSFGPFDYDEKMKKIRERMADLLNYPQIIFAREQMGYDCLKDFFHLNNVVVSTDLVLQNSGIDWHNVFLKKPMIDIPKIEGDNVVGIVPNKQCFSHGDKKWNISIYTAIISQILHDGFKVVIFRHSREDLEFGSMIKKEFIDVENVRLETKEFSCLEYDEYVKQFRFIICSRYHGIVHAYRNSIPAIALGWAIKYKALSECVNQERYAFDITEGKCTINEILEAVRDMERHCCDNSKIICEHVKEIQKKNCFDQIRELPAVE